MVDSKTFVYDDMPVESGGNVTEEGGRQSVAGKKKRMIR